MNRRNTHEVTEREAELIADEIERDEIAFDLDQPLARSQWPDEIGRHAE